MKAFGEFGYISGQITTETIDAAVKEGVSDITQNRPDDEEDGQPLSSALQAYAHSKGLAYHLVPVTPGSLPVEAIESMAAIVSRSNGKILSFCKAGGRGAALLALGLVRSGKATPDTVIKEADLAGQNLSGIRKLLEDVSKTSS